jgi:hypothetical protein
VFVSHSGEDACGDGPRPLTFSLPLVDGKTLPEDLARVVGAWAELPLHIRMTIRSLVDATNGDKVGEAGPTRGTKQAGQG